MIEDIIKIRAAVVIIGIICITLYSCVSELNKSKRFELHLGDSTDKNSFYCTVIDNVAECHTVSSLTEIAKKEVRAEVEKEREAQEKQK